MLLVIGAGAAGVALVNRLQNGLGGADYREGLVPTQRPLSLDPLVDHEDPTVADLGRLLYRGLLVPDASGYPAPDLASALSVSGDGLTYRLTLRAGAEWSDGHPITAADVIQTVAFIESGQFTDVAAQTSWRDVKATAAAGGVVFTLPSPRASFATTLAGIPVLPLAGVQDFHHVVAMAASPMPTSGPYRVTVVTPDAVRLEANPHSDHPATGLKVIVLRVYPSFAAAAQALSAGDIDGLVARTPAEVALAAGASGVSRHLIATFRFVDLIFNERTPGLGDAAVRSAIAAAVDRPALIAKALGGAAVPQTGPIPAGIPWAAAAAGAEGGTPDAANAQLDASGWVRGGDGIRAKNGVRLAFTLAATDVAPMPAVAGALAGQLAPLGIAVTPEPVQARRFAADVLAPERFELAVADWDSGPDPDVSSYWRSTAVPPQGSNLSGAPTDVFLDQALDSLATLSDRDARRQAAQRVAGELAANPPAVFLYAPALTFFVRDTFAGVNVPGTGGGAARFADLPSWRRT